MYLVALNQPKSVYSSLFFNTGALSILFTIWGISFILKYNE